MTGTKTWPDVLPRAGNQGLTRMESISPWFEIYRVKGDTFALLEPFHMEEVISYLIVGSRSAVLFDTGMGIADIGAEIRRLTDLPVVVINSHGHYDHIGGNHLFDEVWVFDDEFEINLVEKGYDPDRCRSLFMMPGSYMNLPPGFDLGDYRIHPAKVTRRLHHLETIDLGDRSLTIHHTPGHSPGSICLHDSRHGFLFIGDFFVEGGNFLQLEESDYSVYRTSLTDLIGLLEGVSRLYSAHNEVGTRKEILLRMDEALDEIDSGRVEGDPEDGRISYGFETFRVILGR